MNYDEGSMVGEGALIVDKYEVPAESVTKNFNTLWHDFGKIQHKEVEIYKRLLILLTDKVMPVLKNPLGFTDFLMESYNVGGSIRYVKLKFFCFKQSRIDTGNGNVI